MGKRKVTILDAASDTVAEVSFFDVPFLIMQLI
jgi:hypothetical protein